MLCTVSQRKLGRLGLGCGVAKCVLTIATLPATIYQYVEIEIEVETTGTDDVTIALAAGPGGAVITGETTVTPVDGVATFTISLNVADSGYQFQFSTDCGDPVTSGPRTVSEMTDQPLGNYTVVDRWNDNFGGNWVLPSFNNYTVVDRWNDNIGGWSA